MPVIRIIVEGKVHKTGYRYFIKQAAEQFRIFGWVRYHNNVRVEILASGKEADLEAFIGYCRIGSPGSIVNSVRIYNEDSIPPEYADAMKIIDNQPK